MRWRGEGEVEREREIWKGFIDLKQDWKQGPLDN